MTTRSPDDVCIWPDGESCEASELHEMQHRSDDYVRVPAGLAPGEPVTDGDAP